jgi:hypothetical protein
MIRVLSTIDRIACKLGRDVLFLNMLDGPDNCDLGFGRPWDERPEVDEATAWLDEHSISWELCFSILPGVIILEGGPMAIYIDVPYQPGSEILAKLEERFETSDGKPKHPELVLTLLPLEIAMRQMAQYQSDSDDDE